MDNESRGVIELLINNIKWNKLTAREINDSEILNPEWGLSDTEYNKKFQCKEGISKIGILPGNTEIPYDTALNTIAGYQFDYSKTSPYKWARGRCIFSSQLKEVSIEYTMEYNEVMSTGQVFEHIYFGFCTREKIMLETQDVPRDIYICSLKKTESSVMSVYKNGNSTDSVDTADAMRITRYIFDDPTSNLNIKFNINFEEDKLKLTFTPWYKSRADTRSFSSRKIEFNYSDFNFSKRKNIVPVVCLGDPRFSLTIEKIEVTPTTRT